MANKYPLVLTGTTVEEIQATDVIPVDAGGTGVTTSTGSGSNVLSTSPTLVTPALGTPSSGTLTSCTGLPLSTGVTGTLPVGNGGTGQTSFTANSVLLGNGTSALQVVAPGTSGNVLTSNGTTWTSAALPAAGTVTSVGIAMPSGFSVANSPVTSSGTLIVTTALSGVLKGTGSAFTAATANTDYLAPALANTSVAGFKTATFNSQTTIATTSGAITVDWTSAQNQLQTEPTGTITYTFTAPPGPCHLQLIINSDGTSTAQTINWPGNLTWMGVTWAGANNKKAVINMWYDGANYIAMGTNQV